MMERNSEASPRTLARTAGAFQLLEAIATACGQVIILGKLVVPYNAAATAANILGRPELFWFGFALSVLGVIFHIVYALLYYDLFKPVNRHLATCNARASRVDRGPGGHRHPVCRADGHPEFRKFLERIYNGAVAGAGLRVCQSE